MSTKYFQIVSQYFFIMVYCLRVLRDDQGPKFRGSVKIIGWNQPSERRVTKNCNQTCIKRQNIKRFKQGVQVLEVPMQQKFHLTLVMTVEALVTNDITKEGSGTCTQEQKRVQEVRYICRNRKVRLRKSLFLVVQEMLWSSRKSEEERDAETER